MAQVVSAVVTDVWRAKLAGIYAGTQTFALPLSFKIGEGGWIDPGGGKEPIPPSTAKTDVDPAGDGYPVGSQFVFTKDLSGVDLTFTSPSRLEIRCFISASEANDDGTGAPPELFELGVFDAVSGGGTMLVYSTFPIEIKTASKALEHVIFVDF
jgi:hypothetical protein